MYSQSLSLNVIKLIYIGLSSFHMEDRINVNDRIDKQYKSIPAS